jgi:hypothetical protein
MELVRHHMALAAELQRPVSLHCVRAYGHLADYFRGLEPDACPPKVRACACAGAGAAPAFHAWAAPRNARACSSAARPCGGPRAPQQRC